jgi:hypothetical protein
MKIITDMLPEFEKVVAAREAETLPLGVGCFNLFRDGEKVKGKRLISFRPYVHPFKGVEENYRDLQAEEEAIQTIFPGYRAPSLAQIKSLVSARKAMSAEIMREGAIAERGLPRASDAWFANLSATEGRDA